ncbi:MAG: MBL fold metallo-hydrolase [Firmicutes bacterium]|nr:MBL fold metallo-hydrolase [Bacillota bacterium]
MKISENLHLIRNEFFVTPAIKRYVNIYLLTGENCYLIDSGVLGAQEIISEYMSSIGRDIAEIKGLFLTHSHPDHIGAAADIQKLSGCEVYAPADEIDWIEDINKQYRQRPIPNFFKLVSESVKISRPLNEGDTVRPENGVEILALYTKGHSHGSMSYILNGKTVFTGDAIPCTNDIPIFVNYGQSLESLDKLRHINGIKLCCPAWDDVCDKAGLNTATDNAKRVLEHLKAAVICTENEFPESTDEEKLKMISRILGIPDFGGNPLFAKSVEACKNTKYPF